MRGKPKGLHAKTGGRKKGTPNKVTMDAIQQLKDAGYEPIVRHLEIVEESWKVYNAKKKQRNQVGAASALDVAERANNNLMKYVYPARRAVEHTGKDGKPLAALTLPELIKAVMGGNDVDSGDTDGE